jgi:molybdopterin-containing oxidoreductase family molybdopterin binding subunit
MKRVGERGKGEWERITWDEALDTIANKMIEIRDKYGAKAVMCDLAGSSYAPSVSVNSGLESARFENLFGMTKPAGWFDDTGDPVSDFFTFNLTNAHDPRDMVNTNLLFIWGANPAESGLRDMKQINRARAKGVQMIVIGPLFDPTAAKADEFVSIRRATDAALALGMLQVIVEENLHDANYLRLHTVGPLLVRDDNGQLLREADITDGGSEDKFVAWGETEGEALVVESGDQDTPGVALEGAYIVEGVACKTAFQKLMEVVNSDYTPEKAAEITGVPVDKIRDLALRYVKAKPACIYNNHGLGRYFRGNLSFNAQKALASVCGYHGLAGGGVVRGGGSGGRHPAFNNAAVQKPTDASASAITFYDAMQALETGKPDPIKMWISIYRNPIQCCPNPKRFIDNIVPNVEFIVDSNIHMDWTAQYADIVLPDATILERITISDIQDHVVLSGPAIEPMYESRTMVWFWSEIAKRVGLGDHFQKSDEDYVRMMLDSQDPALEGITVEKLRDAGGMVRANYPENVPVYMGDMKFGTPTGRIEFYYERLVPFGEELPIYKPSLEAPDSPNADYPLQYFSIRKRYYMHTFMGDIPALKKLRGEPKLDINPIDAKSRDIVDDDWVEAYNDRGHVVMKARLTEMVPPGTVRTDHGPGPEEYKVGHYQEVTLPHAAPETRNLVHDLRYDLAPAAQKSMGGQADIISDVAVQVRKWNE